MDGTTGDVQTDMAVSAYLRFVGQLSPLLMRGLAGNEPLAPNKDEADLIAAMTGLAVVGRACTGEPLLVPHRAIIEAALLDEVVIVRFPQLVSTGSQHRVIEEAEGTFEWLFEKLTLDDLFCDMIALPVEGLRRGETLVAESVALAADLIEATGGPSDSSAWLTAFTENLQQRLKTPSVIQNLGDAE